MKIAILLVVAYSLFFLFVWSPFVRSLGYEHLISIIMVLTGVLTTSLILFKPSLKFVYTQGYLRGLEKGQN
jgi:hypothetical protein